MKTYNVAIIGSGPVGLFGGFQAGMLGMSCVICETQSCHGGQCTAMYPEKKIYDIPGIYSVTGKELIKNLEKQCNRFNHDIVFNTTIESLKIDKNSIIIQNRNQQIKCDCAILSVGHGVIRPKKLMIAGAENCEKSICYFIDKKSKFKDKVIVIAGGGDSAVDWALEFVNIAKKIYFVHRRHKFRCMKHSEEKLYQLVKQNKIELLIPYQMHEMHGHNGKIEKLSLQNFEDETIHQIECDYVMPFFGVESSLELPLDYIDKGIAVDPLTMETKQHKRLYAAGDIARYKNKIKLILTGFSEITCAMYHIHNNYVKPEKKVSFLHSTSQISE